MSFSLHLIRFDLLQSSAFVKWKQQGRPKMALGRTITILVVRSYIETDK